MHGGKEQCIFVVHGIYPKPVQIALVMLYGLLHDRDSPSFALLSPNPDKPKKIILYFPLLCYSIEKGDFYYVTYG